MEDVSVVLEQLGGDHVRWDPRIITTKDIIHISSQIESCTSCGICVDGGPVPFETAPNTDFVVIGEAPGRTEVRLGRPFVGKSGKKLRAMLDDAGLDSTRVTYMNVVSCWPRDGVASTRAPNRVEIANCHKHFTAQLLGTGTHLVLLVGGSALNKIVPGLKIGNTHGRVFIWQQSYVTMAIYHPAAALRNPTLNHYIKEDLTLWAKVVHNPLSALTYVGEGTCVSCGGRGETMDKMGLMYCVLCSPILEGAIGERDYVQPVLSVLSETSADTVDDR